MLSICSSDDDPVDDPLDEAVMFSADTAVLFTTQEAVDSLPPTAKVTLTLSPVLLTMYSSVIFPTNFSHPSPLYLLSSGKSTSTGLPSTSFASYPNSETAIALYPAMRPFRSVTVADAARVCETTGVTAGHHFGGTAGGDVGGLIGFPTVLLLLLLASSLDDDDDAELLLLACGALLLLRVDDIISGGVGSILHSPNSSL